MKELTIGFLIACGLQAGTIDVHSQSYTFTTIAGAYIQNGLGGGWPTGGWADGIGTAAQFAGPWGIAPRPSGDLFVTANNCLRLMTPIGSGTSTQWRVSTPAGDGTAGVGIDIYGTGLAAAFDWPMGITSDAAGDVFIADYYGSTLRQVTPTIEGGQTNWVVTTIYGGQGGLGTPFLAQPVGLALDAAGNLYVAESLGQVIDKLTPPGLTGQTNWSLQPIAGQYLSHGGADGVGTNAQFDFPSGVALDTAGNLYVADADNHTIRRLTPGAPTNWLVTTIAGLAGTNGSADGIGSAARFNTPTGVAVDLAGNIFVADNGNNTIRKITPSVSAGQTNWVVTTIGGLAGRSGTNNGAGSAARFTSPQGIAVDANGNVYVADTGNSLIRMGVPPSLGPIRMSVANGLLQLRFAVARGPLSSFQLLSCESPAGPWIINPNAILSLPPIGQVDYTLSVPASGTSAQFFRVQAH